MQLNIPELESIKIPTTISDEWHTLYRRIKAHCSTEITPVVLFADHGLSTSKFSLTTSNYTSNFAIEASDGVFYKNDNLLAADIAIGRYFQELGFVKNCKVASGTHNLFEYNALEPNRLTNALEKGSSLANEINTDFIYLKGVGAGSDLASELLIKSLYKIQAPVNLCNQSHKVAVNDAFVNLKTDGEHPYHYLEKFGGYETAAFVGLIFNSIEQGKFILIEGESALAAASICIKMFPKTINFIQPIAYNKSKVLDDFCQMAGLNKVFNLPPAGPKLFYLESTKNLMKNLSLFEP